MRKYLIRYLILWAPAILSAYILTPQSPTALQLAQWFFGFFMLLSWAVNTGAAAYSYPRQTTIFIFAYSGVNALLITALRAAPYSSVRYPILVHLAGAFTFRPLHMLYESLEYSSITFREMWMAGIVAGACAAGFLWGMLYRQIRPDPNRPTFIR